MFWVDKGERSRVECANEEMPQPRTRPKKNDDKGIALIVVLLTMTLLLGLIGGALFFTQIDLSVTSNLKTGTQALYIAEAGLNHAITIIPPGGNFPIPPSGLPLTGTFPPGSITSYTVTAANDSEADPNIDANQTIILTAVGSGKDGASRSIKAYVGRAPVFIPPGGIYAPGAAIRTDFDGGNFLVSGNDTNPDGTAGPNPAVPGISTSTDGVRDTITNSLVSGDHQNQVVGLGIFPSVQTSNVTLDPNQIANDLLTYPHTTLEGGNYTGHSTFGTEAAPQITNIVGDISIEGSASGFGVLIVDGTLTLWGSMEFQGLIIARGPIEVGNSANAEIRGAIMLKTATVSDSGDELRIAGSASIYYSSQAIQMVKNLWGPALPKKAILLSWLEQSE